VESQASLCFVGGNPVLLRAEPTKQKTSTLPGYPGTSSSYNGNDQLSTNTYDANGNTTQSLGTGYVYDFENHIV
jgi:hypothetical protein